MTDTVESLTARRDAIRKAKDSGVLKIEHEGKSTTFRSLREMKQIIADINDDIATLQGNKKKRMRRIYQSGKGL